MKKGIVAAFFLIFVTSFPAQTEASWWIKLVDEAAEVISSIWRKKPSPPPNQAPNSPPSNSESNSYLTRKGAYEAGKAYEKSTRNNADNKKNELKEQNQFSYPGCPIHPNVENEKIYTIYGDGIYLKSCNSSNCPIIFEQKSGFT